MVKLFTCYIVILTYPVPVEYQDKGYAYSLKKSTPGHLNPYGAVAIKKEK